MTTPHDEERPVDVPDELEQEEGVDQADAADRVDKDPEEQRNYTDRSIVDSDHPEDS